MASQEEMDLLKYKNDDKEWVTLYQNLFLSYLQKGKNLSDLDDIAAARENLNIDGDIYDETGNHKHPAYTEKMDDLEDIIGENKVTNDADHEEIRTSISNNEAKILQLRTDLDSAIEHTQSGKLDADLITVSATQPASKKGAVWFDTKERLIKAYDGNKWITFGGVWA